MQSKHISVLESAHHELPKAAVSEKTPHTTFFRPIPDDEYLVLFVERFMARE
ncbi:hypothetical protein GBAR_LOCUS10369 [Geodia barretti]|uniref:Uncharacterized protein n=1 Tax=Geodia barretti TaxID=519541 RepID=A0AA35RSM3_GEOBA|nr:hypothetical protein GBAR_LOCUS10369 [Geodia barretti]